MSQNKKGTPSRIVAVSFGVSVLASVGLTVVYALGGQVQAEGALLAAALGGLAVGFIVWGKTMMPGGHFVQERESHASPLREREEAERDFAAGEEAIGRRTLLGRMLAAAATALGIAALFPIRSLGEKPGDSLFETAWAEGKRLVTVDGIAVRAADLAVGGVLTVFPEGSTTAGDSPALLMHLDPGELEPGPEREGWTPEGFIAYSKLCTHAGCAVGLYEQSSQRLFCPCHQSVFDVTKQAAPIGGPAPRPLPQLPLAIDAEGFLVATGDFSEPVSAGFWDRD